MSFSNCFSDIREFGECASPLSTEIIVGFGSVLRAVVPILGSKSQFLSRKSRPQVRANAQHSLKSHLVQRADSANVVVSLSAILFAGLIFH
jgi:hypothetical protein